MSSCDSPISCLETKKAIHLDLTGPFGQNICIKHRRDWGRCSVQWFPPRGPGPPKGFLYKIMFIPSSFFKYLLYSFETLGPLTKLQIKKVILWLNYLQFMSTIRSQGAQTEEVGNHWFMGRKRHKEASDPVCRHKSPVKVSFNITYGSIND